MDFDLDSLLEESVDLAKKEKQMRASQKAGKKGAPQSTAGWMNKEEIETHYKEVAALAAKVQDWHPLSAVLLIHAQICTTCGTENQRYEGLFIKRENLKLRAVNYIIPKAVLEYSTLPKEVEIRTSLTSICPSCYVQQGWDDAPITIKE